ncbi:MAG: hypothetical protein VYB06_04405, partial [Cyanobacteriota bacterium]|nr:hypothetical protein [Cyanobacteriota bacterium]
MRTSKTKIEKPRLGAFVGPVAGGGGGGGRSEGRRAETGRAADVAVMFKFGKRIDQLAGRCKLGASNTISSCFAFWRSSRSLQR